MPKEIHIIKMANALIGWVTSRGVRQGLTELELRRIKVTNFFALTLCLVGVPYFVMFQWIGAETYAWLHWVFVALYASCIGINQLGMPILARTLLLAVFNGMVFLYAMKMGQEVGLDHMLFAIATLPILLFGREMKFHLGLWIMIPVTLEFLLTYLGLSPSGEFEMLADPLNSQKIRMAAIPGTYLILVPSVIYISNLHNRTERELLQANTIFRQLTDAFEDVIWLTDPQKKKMIFISPAYEKVWGRTCQGLLDDPMSFFHAIHPEDQKRLMEPISRQNVDIYNEEYRVVRPDGSIRWIRDRAFPIFDEHGVAYRVCGIAQDVTHEKETEAQIAEQNARMAVAARLSSLGEMAGGIAHEINTPLATVTMLSGEIQELLAKDPPSLEQVNANARTIESATFRIAKILKGLRLLAREGSHDPKALQPLDKIFDELLPFCLQRFSSHGVALETEPPPAGARVWCRPTEILQILVNLLNNAFDAVSNLERDRKWIRLSAVQLASGEIELSVVDGGHGISPEVRLKLFQPFHTTKDPGKGTGLGLSISKGIAHAHGGDLYLDGNSKETRFVLRLPPPPPEAR